MLSQARKNVVDAMVARQSLLNSIMEEQGKCLKLMKDFTDANQAIPEWLSGRMTTFETRINDADKQVKLASQERTSVFLDNVLDSSEEEDESEVKPDDNDEDHEDSGEEDKDENLSGN